MFGAALVDKMDGPANPSGADTVTHSVVLYCTAVDDVVARAESRGATIRATPQDFATGDRFASILDPFGIRWTVMTRVEDLTAAERERRMAEWAEDNVGQPG